MVRLHRRSAQPFLALRGPCEQSFAPVDSHENASCRGADRGIGSCAVTPHPVVRKRAAREAASGPPAAVGNRVGTSPLVRLQRTMGNRAVASAFGTADGLAGTVAAVFGVGELKLEGSVGREGMNKPVDVLRIR